MAEDEPPAGGRPSADPTRLVADADVLAADLLVGGDARAALDLVRSHSWLTLLASDALLDDAEAVIADLADEHLAADWREAIDDLREPVSHVAGDHPGLASAAEGNAAHLLSVDDTLTGAKTHAALQPHVALSIRPPAAFVALFDPASLYEATHDGAYPGPDRDPRA